MGDHSLFGSTSPKRMLVGIWVHRDLLMRMVRREISARYRGSLLGTVWSVITPILMIVVYTLVFSGIFNARWTSADSSTSEYGLVLFAGLIVFNFFSECINRAPLLIVANVNYVKRVVFPLEILACVSLGSALFQCGLTALVWLVAYAVLFGVPHPTVLLLPLVWLPLALFTVGLSWWIASLGVYLRDVSHAIGPVTAALMFLSPVFYPAAAVPEGLRQILYLNPLTFVIELTRDVLCWGKLPDWGMWSFGLVASAGAAWAGFAWFEKTRKGFADVL